MKSKITLSPLFLSIFMSLAMGVSEKAFSQSLGRSAAQTQTSLESPASANRQILSWLKDKEKGVSEWMATRSDEKGIPDYADFHLVKKEIALSPLTPSEAQIAADTKALYDQYFPRTELSSFVGTFFESGNPHVNTRLGPAQWDSYKAAGLDQNDVFEKAVKNVIAAGVKSIRLGPNLFEIKQGGLQSWQKFIDKVDTIWEAGGTPTISIAFFPSLERWKVLDAHGKVDESKSFLLNPRWPADMAAMTKDMMAILNVKATLYERRTGKKANFVINPINEPETLAGFNRQFWHGAYANWSSPLMMKYYIPSVINIGKANVAIRQAVEESSGGKRILFMHNEAMTPIYYPSHKGPGRFAVSKFMLGDDLVVKTNFDSFLNVPLDSLRASLKAGAKAKTLNEVQWAFNEFVFGSWNKTPDLQEAARVELVAQFKDLQAAHKNFFAKTHKTIKTDNMLWLDYYYQTEFILNRPIPKLISQLAANHGALLKTVLDVKDDATVLRMFRTTITESKKRYPFVNLEIPAGDSLANIDLQELLSAEDSTLFELLIGIRNEYGLSSDPVTTARRSFFKLFNEKVYRTDELLTTALKDEAARLRQALKVRTDAELLSILEAAGRDTSDHGPVVTINSGDSLREILTKNDRKILERVFGMNRERLLGFEPTHYARHIRLGIRDGFYKFAMDYINTLRIHTVGVGESGTPFYVFAPLLHDQVMMEYAHVLKAGVYGTQYAFGPAVDTRGWAKGPLSLHPSEDTEINPSGLFSIVKKKNSTTVIERTFVPDTPGWAKIFLQGLFDGLRGK